MSDRKPSPFDGFQRKRSCSTNSLILILLMCGICSGIYWLYFVR